MHGRDSSLQACLLRALPFARGGAKNYCWISRSEGVYGVDRPTCHSCLPSLPPSDSSILARNQVPGPSLADSGDHSKRFAEARPAVPPAIGIHAPTSGAGLTLPRSIVQDFACDLHYVLHQLVSLRHDRHPSARHGGCGALIGNESTPSPTTRAEEPSAIPTRSVVPSRPGRDGRRNPKRMAHAFPGARSSGSTERGRCSFQKTSSFFRLPTRGEQCEVFGRADRAWINGGVCAGSSLAGGRG